MKGKEGAAFIVLMLASAAMDSENPIIPGIVAVCAALVLLGQAIIEK